MKKTKTITGFFATLTFLLAAVGLQLWFNKDHYFAMNRAKCSFTMIVLMGAFVTWICGMIEGIWRKREKQKMTLLDWCVMVFGCSSIVTCLLSEDFAFTFVGTKGMFVGGFTYFTGMFVYFVVSRNMEAKPWVINTVLVAWTAIFVWTILNQCGVDLFGMHKKIRPGDEYFFVSSMGNANSASDAFATIIPFSVILMLLENNKYKRLAFLVVSFIGLLAAYALDCEGVLIGLLAIMPFAIVTALSDIKRVNIAIIFMMILGLSIAVYHFLGVCSFIKSTNGLVFKAASYWIGEVVLVISIIMLFSRNVEILKFNNETLRLTRIVLALICLTILVGFITVSVTKSFYDPNYGSGRGAIWKGNVWTFRLYSIKEMIFGQGSGMFAKNATLAYSMLFGYESELTFATSHNSLLQALLGNGIIGLTCLLLGIIAVIRDWYMNLKPIVMRPVSKYENIRNIEFDEIVRVASFAAVMGYVGASLVESTYPHTVMLLFTILGLYRSCFLAPKHTRV